MKSCFRFISKYVLSPPYIPGIEAGTRTIIGDPKGLVSQGTSCWEGSYLATEVHKQHSTYQ